MAVLTLFQVHILYKNGNKEVNSNNIFYLEKCIVVMEDASDLALSPGPAQKSGKGPGVNCKVSPMCCVSNLHLE